MQDYTPIAGFSLTLAGQRVSMHKCGSDPPNAGHLAPMVYTKWTKVFQHIQTVPHGRNMHAT